MIHSADMLSREKNMSTKSSTLFKYQNQSVRISIPSGTGNVAKVLSKGRFYEQKLLKYIQKQEISGVYIDVGANIGNHSVFFGLFTKAEKVLGIEPNVKVFSVLQKNVKQNSLNEKIELHNVAAGAKKGKCALKIDPSDEIGGSQVIDGNEIDQIKLDQFAKHQIGLIKADVEGFEKYVLEGAHKILAKHKPELFIEASNKQYYAEVYDLIKEYGYQPIATFNNTATYHFSARKKPNLFLRKVTSIYPLRRALFYS